MEIFKEKQYNQGIGKYKLLSSTAGVGSLIATKWGGFIMPLSISEWGFVRVLSERLADDEYKNDSPQRLQNDTGVEIIEDLRFVEFLKKKKQFGSLKYLVSIPHVQLDSYNQIDKEDHPLYKRRLNGGAEMTDNMFYIPATPFPRWFISNTNHSYLKPIDEWFEKWQEDNCNGGTNESFVPPRDPLNKTNRKIGNNNIYGLLKPVPLVLICPNGHISDIPWYEYFCAKLEHKKIDWSKGFDLSKYHDAKCPKCTNTNGRHSLQWIVNRNRSESWGTLKCEFCGEKVSLEGIMNIKPICNGERPWISGNNREVCITDGKRTTMRVALVTSNSVYYASCISSLYIPNEYLEGYISSNARKFLEKIQKTIYPTMLKRNETLTREDFWEQEYKDFDSLKKEADYCNSIKLTDDDCNAIKQAFLNPKKIDDDDDDILATFRYEEYQVFAKNERAPGNKQELKFDDIDLPSALSGYFTKIQKVETLAVTTTQLDFSRVTMPFLKIENGKVIYPDKQIKPIYSGDKNDVMVLPANQLFGEGIFFMFDEKKVRNWSENKIGGKRVEDLYECNLPEDDIGKFTYERISKYGKARFYLLHTFSHLIIKELEFSCGYPSASLCERLYYSDKMCGVLIYTADGSEGSMGGLVWQGQSDLIEKIIKKALHKAFNCSSDPMCWENEDGLNRAACFSCCMISETSCEERNLGLDRRALVDPTYGYFKDLI